MSTVKTELRRQIEDARLVLSSLCDQETRIVEIAGRLTACLHAGGKALFCGNGGSACEASHFSAELMGRFRADRGPLSAISLSTDAALMSCVGNDYAFSSVFARQIVGLARAGDLLFCLSTSGNSENIVEALLFARNLGVEAVAFLGKVGGRCKGIANYEIIVQSGDTARIQEAHLFLLHAMMDIVDAGERN